MFPKIKGTEYRPQIVGHFYKDTPKEDPQLSETPNIGTRFKASRDNPLVLLPRLLGAIGPQPRPQLPSVYAQIRGRVYTPRRSSTLQLPSIRFQKPPNKDHRVQI